MNEENLRFYGCSFSCEALRGCPQHPLFQSFNSCIEVALRRRQVRVTCDFHQFVVGEFTRLAEATQSFVAEIVPMQVDLIEALRDRHARPVSRASCRGRSRAASTIPTPS